MAVWRARGKCRFQHAEGERLASWHRDLAHPNDSVAKAPRLLEDREKFPAAFCRSAPLHGGRTRVVRIGQWHVDVD
jgi:hypothetical protein